VTRKTPLRLAHFAPLAGFVVPTVVIGYGFVIPRSCIAGWNELTIGFAATVLGACLTYWAGVRLALSAGEKRDGEV
jgi:ABC-type Fe3+ transport system permease subunit